MAADLALSHPTSQHLKQQMGRTRTRGFEAIAGALKSALPATPFPPRNLRQSQFFARFQLTPAIAAVVPAAMIFPRSPFQPRAWRVCATLKLAV